MEVKNLAESIVAFINSSIPVAEKPQLTINESYIEIIFATKTGGKQFVLTVEEMERCASCGDINWRFVPEQMGWVCNQCNNEMNIQ